MANELGKAQASENMQEHATDADLDHKIRRRAYQIWMEEGQPEGCDRQHWNRARADVLARRPIA
jgi:hypothetical protein